MAKKRHYSSHRMKDEGHHSPMDGHNSAMFKDGDMRYHAEGAADRSSHNSQQYNDKDRHDRGNERAVFRRFRALGDEIYAGMEPRRRQEMEDAGYIHEDHNQIANLPQYPIVKSYPKSGNYMPEGLEDSIRGVDAQMDYDDDQRSAHWYPKKV